VILLHPEIAARSCDDCQKYLYFDRGPSDFGVRVERGGKPCPRPKNVKPPCKWCPKILPGDEPVPANAQELSEKNVAAFLHYQEARATGHFEHDAIVARNAAMIRSAEDAAERAHQARTGLTTLAALHKVM
jgi:hypothetical protein